MIVSAWYDGHGSYGFRVLVADVSLYFRPEWTTVTVYLPDEPDPVQVALTASFWQGSPELRSPRIKTFFLRNDLAPWEKKRPPCFELIPLGEGVFRIEWIVRPRGQPSLPLG
ncbi:MAG: hypothetical protein MUE90_14335 [Thermoanaerobaculales bacterium]|jgi:hypothetical protein|nr:hypothetical protein [Thermoanaerobaculales bacterium]